MFEAIDTARVFALPPGVAFADRFAQELARRLTVLPMQARSTVEVCFNTRRALRKVQDCLIEASPAVGLLPRLRMLDAQPENLIGEDQQTDPLRRRLVLARLLATLLENRPDLGPRAAALDLAESLARLLDELGEAGLTADALAELDAGPYAAHWRLGQGFSHLIAKEWPQLRQSLELGMTDPGAALRARVEARLAEWKTHPPMHPVIIAGSTGSRAPVYRLLQAVARLPQGAIILPGLDREMDETLMSEVLERPEHPQFGVARVLRGLGLCAKDVAWWDDTVRPSPRRELISMALRPAPVTDVWLQARPQLARTVQEATAGITLIEAPTPNAEVAAIAWAMRRAVHKDQSVALVTPDGTIARRVTAALRRWGIEPDDSAGRPLSLTPPGIFMRLIADALTDNMTSADLIALLRHPLAGGADERRKAHVFFTDHLEHLVARYPGTVPLTKIAEAGHRDAPEGWMEWFEWVRATLGSIYGVRSGIASRLSLETLLSRHLAIAEAVCAGAVSGAQSQLWETTAGAELRSLAERILAAHPVAGPMTYAEYRVLFSSLLAAQTIRLPAMRARRDIRILGTLEARTEAADLMILGGLNEDVWPAAALPDPWLNRSMRQALGLSVPERLTGLAAHDFQSAASHPTVILSRAGRDASAPTVSSRWLTRLSNLIKGLGPEGEKALKMMTGRGDRLIAEAHALDRPEKEVKPAPRPAPRTPKSAFPKTLFVTQIETLIRDPYASYARHILGLRAVPLPGRAFDARERGNALHLVLEALASWPAEHFHSDHWPQLEETARSVFQAMGVSAAQASLWMIRLRAIETPLMEHLRHRATARLETRCEVVGGYRLPQLELKAKADRLDILPGGALSLIDYKADKPPSKAQIESFQQQMPLSGLIAARGGFTDGQMPSLESVSVQGLGAEFKTLELLDQISDWDQLERNLETLLARFDQEAARWPARLRPEYLSYEGDYDHLARYGEWDDRDAWLIPSGGRADG